MNKKKLMDFYEKLEFMYRVFGGMYIFIFLLLDIFFDEPLKDYIYIGLFILFSIFVVIYAELSRRKKGISISEREFVKGVRISKVSMFSIILVLTVIAVISYLRENFRLSLFLGFAMFFYFRIRSEKILKKLEEIKESKQTVGAR